MTALKEQKTVSNSTHNCEQPQAKSCSSSRLMAFVIPFLVITGSNVVCHGYSIQISSTMGLLAGAASFGLYSAIKSILRTVRAERRFEYEQVKVAEH